MREVRGQRKENRGEKIEGRGQKTSVLYLLLSVLYLLALAGCGWNFKTVRERQLEQETQQLQGRLAEAEKSRKEILASLDKLQAQMTQREQNYAKEIKQLVEEKQLAARQAVQEKAREADQLLEAQRRLAESLKQELGDARAKLEMTQRGLVLTFLDEIFFDSGKSVIKPEGIETLQKVIPVLQETVPNSPVAVEGHTDDEPIKYSGWMSNWELSTARALAVVHHLVEAQGFLPQRLRAVGYGEHHPVALNDTSEGRRANRRVEIVIFPESLQKVKSRD